MCCLRLGDYTREDLNSDLHHLSQVDPSFVHTVAQHDIDPLLQVNPLFILSLCVHDVLALVFSVLDSAYT